MRNYPRRSFSIARISHPELPNHSPQPIGFTALDYLKRCRTFESRVRSFKPRTNLWSRNNFGECVEEARHLRDIPLICPIRRIPGEPRCHSPSGGSHEASESIRRNIYFTAEIADASGLPFPPVMSQKLRRSSSRRPLRRGISFSVRSNCCAALSHDPKSSSLRITRK